MNSLKRIVTKIIRVIILPSMYDKKIFKSKWFDNHSTVGYRWVIRSIVWQKIFGFNRHIPWPVSPFNVVVNSKNITFHPDDLNNFNTYGTYFQNFSGHIYIGKGTHIAPNVGLITANHDTNNLQKHLPGKDISIGENCWIGMNSVILPGVVLGDKTIVGAGSIVTKSFEEGNCVIAGNPAKIIKKTKEVEVNNEYQIH